jgi:hypothetical protein
MINLLGTTDSITVTNTAASDLAVHASWVDLNGTTVTPGNTNTPLIATATTTTVVAAPGASTYRNVKFLSVYCQSAIDTVTITHVNGTASEVLLKAR